MFCFGIGEVMFEYFVLGIGEVMFECFVLVLVKSCLNVLFWYW